MPSPTQKVELPPQLAFVSAAWVTPSVAILGVATLDNNRIGANLYSLALTGTAASVAEPSLIRLPDDPSCRLILDTSPTRLTDGRLAEARYCNGPRGPDFSVQAISLAGAFGPELGDLQRNNPSQISLNPDATRGIFGISSLICAGIGFFGPSGVSPMPPIEIGSGGQAFRLNDALAASDCTSTGNADDPDWSPDGATIAFLASPSAVGAGSRSDEPYDLDLAPASQLLAGNPRTPLRTILTGIARPTGTRWSPDGRWLVVAGNLNGSSGTWIVRASDGQVRQASVLALRTPSWSPDGTHIAGIDNPGGSEYKANLILIDVSALVRGS